MRIIINPSRACCMTNFCLATMTPPPPHDLAQSAWLNWFFHQVMVRTSGHCTDMWHWQNIISPVCPKWTVKVKHTEPLTLSWKPDRMQCMAGILLIGGLLHVYCFKGSEVCNKIISGRSNDHSENIVAKANSLHSENVLITVCPGWKCAEIKHPVILQKKTGERSLRFRLNGTDHLSSPQERVCRFYTSQTHWPLYELHLFNCEHMNSDTFELFILWVSLTEMQEDSGKRNSVP